MDDRTNTIAGWVLGAGIVALGASIVSGEIFHNERPETMGYPIEGVEDASAAGKEVEKPIAFYLATADVAKGADVFKRCASCHNAAAGGPNGIGPNLYSIIGSPHAQKAGFAYSSALSGKPGNWDWDSMSAWLLKPKAYAEGTKMAFAGLSSPEDRANVIAYLNSQSAAPLPLPAVPAAAAAVAGSAGDGGTGDDNSLAKPGTGTANNGPQKAENEPIITEQQAAKAPEGNIGGEGAPAVNGGSGQEKE